MTTTSERRGGPPEHPARTAGFTPAAAASIALARQHSVSDLLRRTALRYPGKLAIVAGQRRASFAEFDAAVNRCANALAAEGVAKGDKIALLSHNSWPYAVLAFVFGISHPLWIEAVTAVIVPKDGALLTEDQVNPSGKILKKDLRATYADLATEA